VTADIIESEDVNSVDVELALYKQAF